MRPTSSPAGAPSTTHSAALKALRRELRDRVHEGGTPRILAQQEVVGDALETRAARDARAAAARAGRRGGLERRAGLRAHHGRATLPRDVGRARRRRRGVAEGPARRWSRPRSRAGRTRRREELLDPPRQVASLDPRGGGADRRPRATALRPGASADRPPALRRVAPLPRHPRLHAPRAAASPARDRCRRRRPWMPERPAPLVLVATPDTGQPFGTHAAVAAEGQRLLAAELSHRLGRLGAAVAPLPFEAPTDGAFAWGRWFAAGARRALAGAQRGRGRVRRGGRAGAARRRRPGRPALADPGRGRRQQPLQRRCLRRRRRPGSGAGRAGEHARPTTRRRAR